MGKQPRRSSPSTAETFRLRRQLVHPSKREAMLHHLGRRLRIPFFFRVLRRASPTAKVVKRYSYEGVPIVIKDTEGMAEHGYEFEELRRAVLEHQKAVRDGRIVADRYRIKTPKVYGRVGRKGRYLVMEDMGERHPDMHSLGERDYDAARKQAYNNFEELVRRGNIKRAPQVLHMMPLGNTNPKEPEKGVWLTSLPYDYI